jgi:hypothetical protein
MKLSRNFTVNEFIKSQTATRHEIDNSMGSKEFGNAKELAIQVLQPVRDHFGRVTISSGYRSPELNKKIGGSTTSQHCKGEAADIECHGVSNATLAKWIVENLEFDQCILEFHDLNIPNSGWVHVSHSRGDNRKNFLSATKVKGKTVYKNISIEDLE